MPEMIPLSLPQMDIYLDQVRYERSPLYNIGGYIKCVDIDENKLRIAHKDVVSRNDAFGIRIVSGGQNVCQYISADRTTELEVIPFVDRLDADRWVRQLFKTPFNIEDKELFKAYLVKILGGEYWYVGMAHHLVSDGWGFHNWAKQLADHYNTQPLDEQAVKSWEDVVQSDNHYLQSELYRRDKSYWSSLTGTDIALKLKPEKKDVLRDGAESSSNRITVLYPREKFDALSGKEEIKKYGVPQFLIAVLSFYLSGMLGSKSVSIGVQSHGRKGYAQRKMVGVFTTVSPLILEVQGENSFFEHLKGAASRLRGVFKHQKFPFGHTVSVLRTLSETASLCDVVFNYLKLDLSDFKLGESGAELVYIPHDHTQTPLTLTVWDGAGKDIELQFEYNLDYFSHDDVDRFSNFYTWLLDFVQSIFDAPLSQLPLVSKFESKSIDERLSSTAKEDYDLIRDRVVDVANMFPHKLAVSDKSAGLTYAQLLCQSTAIAKKIADGDVGQRNVIAVCVDRGLNIVSAPLGVLLAKKAFLNVDPYAPAARISKMLAEVACEFIICCKSTIEIVRPLISKSCTILVLDSQSDICCYDKFTASSMAADSSAKYPKDIAYIIYTSGTTGTPKGVEVSNHAFSSHIAEITKQIDLNVDDNVLQLTPYSFDTYLEQVFGGLYVGASIYVNTGMVPTVDEFFSIVQEQKITITDLPVVYLRELVNSSAANWNKSGLRTVVVGGEPLANDIVTSWFELGVDDSKNLFNAYGPTEAVITATIRKIEKSDENNVSIGEPVGDRQLYILDEHLRQVPIGATGELYIAGQSIAEGYFNNTVETERCFIYLLRNNLRVKAYKTGDYVRLSRDGCLEYIGRIDSQIKIRGHRVELSDIERGILSIEIVDSCIVTAKTDKDGNSRLSAYIKFKDSSALNSSIRAEMAGLLPHYMMPTEIYRVDEWPLSSSGKIDFSELQSLNLPLCESASESPVTTHEIYLADLWATLLNVNVESIDINTHFFEFGGDSLLLMKMHSTIEKHFTVSIELQNIYDDCRIKSIASLIELIEKRLSVSLELDSLRENEIEEIEL